LLYDFEFITEFNEIMPVPKGFSTAKTSLLFTVAELQGCDTAQCAMWGCALLNWFDDEIRYSENDGKDFYGNFTSVF
jgi:hypothetical protein